MRRNGLAFTVVCLIAGVALNPTKEARGEQNPFARVGHIVVIVTENRSFDQLFGFFPGAEGLAAGTFRQVDFDGSTLARLPPIPKDARDPNSPIDGRFPAKLPNAPFAVEAFVPMSEDSSDLVHDFYVEQEQIDGGKMDRFAATSDAGGLTMGYYYVPKFRQWELAKEFTLADHFFHGAFGGSFLNHMFLVSARAPTFPNAPESIRPKIDKKTGWLARKPDSPRSALNGPPRYVKTGAVTPDGYAYGTLQPATPIADDVNTPDNERLPPQSQPTIGDRLSEKGVSWAWFAEGWKEVLAGKIKPYTAPDYFQTHHQPFIYFSRYAPGTPGREEHLKDAAEFFDAIDRGDLPAVSFFKPLGKFSEHPGYANLAAGDAHLGEIVARLRAGPNWKDMLIVVTSDENGGAFDHMAPPKRDRFGPGTRIPTLIISPFARKGFVDHTTYDFNSILRTIEARYGLKPLTKRDAAANDFRAALEPLTERAKR
jgi:acid phosphatase